MPRQVLQHNVCLAPAESTALRLLASEQRHGNRSAAVAELIDRTMADRYGVDWRERIADIEKGAAVVPA